MKLDWIWEVVWQCIACLKSPKRRPKQGRQHQRLICTVMCQARETTHASSLRPRWVAWRAPIHWAWLFLPALSRCSRPSKLEVFGQYIPGDYYYVVYCLSCKLWSWFRQWTPCWVPGMSWPTLPTLNRQHVERVKRS